MAVAQVRFSRYVQLQTSVALPRPLPTYTTQFISNSRFAAGTTIAAQALLEARTLFVAGCEVHRSGLVADQALRDARRRSARPAAALPHLHWLVLQDLPAQQRMCWLCRHAAPAACHKRMVLS